MRLLALGGLIAVVAGQAALAAEQTAPVVRTASASFSGTNPRTLVIRATVDLTNMCWSNPRFEPPPIDVKPDADGVVPITVIADYAGGAGLGCAMIFRQGVTVPPLRWKTYPTTGLKAVKVMGSTTPVIATVTPAPDAP